MIDLILALILLSASLSLLSYVYCWHDIKNGRPHIISLRQVTNIMDRAQLNQMFGKPQPGYYYKLTPPRLRALIRSRQLYVYGEITADSLCLLGAYRYLAGYAGDGGILLFIALAGACQAINVGWSFWLVRRWGHQLKEEIENSED